MSFAKTTSAQPNLLRATTIAVEADISRGLHSFTIVGLPDKAVEESKDRVSAAIKNSGFTSPKSKNQKVVISLAPADLKKEGPAFDLPMALSYLLAAEEITFDPAGKVFFAELSLDGELRPVSGVLPVARHAKDAQLSELYVAPENAREAGLVAGLEMYAPKNLRELLEHLTGKRRLTPIPPTPVSVSDSQAQVSFDDIRGQETAKRALLIAAAGGHNILLWGPPGTGKTLLARALCDILPTLSAEAVLEATSIHSVAGTLRNTLITRPPLRTPHHTASYVSLVGGGAIPRPGEITLAHHGVLFLDEFPEFDRRVIDALREPLEERVVSISRARGSARFPARFMLVAAMNPCPCGNFGSAKACLCMPHALERYRRKISGPIVDRIDLWIEVPNLPHEKLLTREKNGERDRMCHSVERARAMQNERMDAVLNADIPLKALEEVAPLQDAVKEVLLQAAARLALSPRAFHRVIKVARTIADLAEAPRIEKEHLLEALQYRPREIRYS